MFYIYCVSSFDSYGPFMSRDKAHNYAANLGLSAYEIVTDRVMQRDHLDASLHLVPAEVR